MFLPRRIATAASGIVASSKQLISSNSEYFMYGTKFCLYFYKLPEMVLFDTISRSEDPFKITRLSPTNKDLVFCFTRTCKLMLYDLKSHQIIHVNSELDKKLKSAEFSIDGKFIYCCFSDTSILLSYNVQDYSYTYISVSISSPRMFVPIPSMPGMLLFAYKGDGFVFVNAETGATSDTNIITSPYAIKFDPLNLNNCLLITKLKKWAYIILQPRPRIITTCDRQEIQMSSGDWIPAMPGHIITGDKNHGIIYIWSVSSGAMAYSQTIGDSAVTNITRISNKDFVIAFEDGMIGQYDVNTKQMEVKVPRAHINTVFAANFLPTDPNILATAGGDGRVCFWQLPNLRQMQGFTLEENKHSLYSMSISWGGGYIATGNSKGDICIYSTKTNKLFYKVRLHSANVMSLQWSPTKPNIIASAGQDNQAFIYDIMAKNIVVKITVKYEFRHLQWSKKNDTLAIACGDGSLYVRMDGGSYFIIKGSKVPLFDVQWSPNDENFVASTDDDGDILVFDVANKSCIKAHGHKGPARCVAWVENQPDLLLSGGYDGRVVFWNAKTMTQLTSVVMHSGHIYGIAMHPLYPEMFATISYDCTVRLWSIEQAYPTKKLEELMSGENYAISKYCNYNGVSALEKLLHRVTKDGTRLSFKDDDVIHIRDVLRIAKKRVQKLTQALPSEQSQIMRSKNARKTAMEAAELALKSGHPKKYCELMFICGEFDMALSVAPSVSYNFWQTLVSARAAMLKGSQEAADLLIIAGKPLDAINELISQDCYDAALLVASAMREQTFSPTSKIEFSPSEGDTDFDFIKEDFDSSDFLVYNIASQKSRQLALEGQPFLAAAALLSIGDVIGCIWRLIHAGELGWAYQIAKLTDKMTDDISELFFKWCCKYGLGQKAFSNLSPVMKRSFAPYMKITGDSELNKFYEKNGMKKVSEYLSEAKHSRGLPQAAFMVLAGRVDEAIQTAVSTAKQIMSKPDFDYMQLKHVVTFITNAATQCDITQPHWVCAVAICHYFGAYKAFWRGFHKILPMLAQAFEDVANKSGEDYLKGKIEEVNLLASLSLATHVEHFNKFVQNKNLTENAAIKAASETVKKGDIKAFVGGTTVMPASPGVVPVDIDALSDTLSFWTGKRISGNAILLDDNKSMLSVEMGLMYGLVTPFSPLPSASLFFPF